MLEVLYCCECQEHLEEYGIVASELFIRVCNSYLLYKRPVSVKTDVHAQNHGLLETIRFLELKHYVVSFEHGKDCVLVKPLGVSCIEEQDNYRVCHVCFERENHG